ncbi:MAG: hypothetical protein KF763_00955 [Cyclobacteriaceae bacterium]|nr:hypothetical protein [Cyclobacteriaceae bacterium]
MKRLFTERQIGVSAVIGGPISAGLLFFLNYKRLNKDKEAYISLSITLLFTVALFYTLLTLPATIVDKIPNVVITGGYGILIYFLYKRFLSSEVNKHLSEGCKRESNWSVAGFILLGVAISLLIILGLASSQPAFEGKKITYGKIGHEIYFDDSKTSIEDANKLGSVLTNAGYFTEEFPVAVYLETWNTRYLVTLQIGKDYWDNPTMVQELTSLKSELAIAFEKEVTLILEDFDLAGKKYEKRI